MKYQKIGKTGPEVSRIGFGCWALGGDSHYGKVDDTEADRAIHRAIDLGVTLFDTAPVYGFGASEGFLGRSLGKQREDIVLLTKGGHTWDPVTTTRKPDARYSSLKQGLDDSLRRLGTDYVDIFLLHWPDPGTPAEETMRALNEMVSEGKIRHIGVCNHDGYELREAAQFAPIIANEVGYNMLDRRWEAEMFPAARDIGASIIAYGAMGHGLLTGTFQRDQTLEPGDWRESGWIFGQQLLGPNLSANLDVVDELMLVAESIDTTLPRMALAWVLRDPLVAVALAGVRASNEIEENVKAVDIELPADVLAKIDAALDRVVGRSEVVPGARRPR